MTPQNVFDKAVSGVLAQGGPALSDSHSSDLACSYLNAKGRKCAVGHLLTAQQLDVLKRRNMLEKSVEALAMMGLGGMLVKDHIALLVDLQRAHDFSTSAVRKIVRDKHHPQFDKAFVDEFKRRVREVALRFNLSAAVVDRFDHLLTVTSTTETTAVIEVA